jgi:hypothetical protein
MYFIVYKRIDFDLQNTSFKIHLYMNNKSNIKGFKEIWANLICISHYKEFFNCSLLFRGKNMFK